MASNPLFAATPKFRNLILNATNAGDAAYINPTTIATVLTIGSTNGRIDAVYLQPTGTNAGSVVRLFVDIVGTGGTNNILVHEETVAAATSTSTDALAFNVWYPSMPLPANAVLRATVANTAVTNGIAINVSYSEF